MSCGAPTTPYQQASVGAGAWRAALARIANLFAAWIATARPSGQPSGTITDTDPCRTSWSMSKPTAPSRADYSMVCFGAIIVEPSLQRTFYGQLKPDLGSSSSPQPWRSAASRAKRRWPSTTRADVMRDFAQWIAANTTGRPMFISDNNGFDWQFINWYFHALPRQEPLRPLSSTNLGSLYKGLVKDTSVNFKHLRKTQAHAPSGRRRPRQRRGTAAPTGRAGLKIDLR